MDDEAKLTLHGLQQHYVKLKDAEKNRKLFELLDVLEFNQVVFNTAYLRFIHLYKTIPCLLGCHLREECSALYSTSPASFGAELSCSWDSQGNDTRGEIVKVPTVQRFPKGSSFIYMSTLRISKQIFFILKRILIATNLFGRGMDIERVNIVFNYDMPEDTDTYLHRVARAGRFGTKVS